MIQLHKMAAIPDHVHFDGYYEATCEISLRDHDVVFHDCVVHRPGGRNIVGDRITDWLALVVETELTEDQLASATIGIARYGKEISEPEARARAGRT